MTDRVVRVRGLDGRAGSRGARRGVWLFAKLRRELDVTEFGVNVITIPPGYSTGGHFHERQQELYFVHRGAIEMTFGDGAKQELREGGAARWTPQPCARCGT